MIRMFAMRSLVLGALLSIWQHVKCQDQEFAVNSGFVPIPTLTRPSGNSRVMSTREINQPNFYNQMNYDNLDIGKRYEGENSNSNMNSNQDYHGPSSWHQGKSMGRGRQRRIRDRKSRTVRIKPIQDLPTNVQNILKAIDPDLSGLDIDLKFPFSNDFMPQLFSRRSGTTPTDDEDSSCSSFIGTMLFKIGMIKNIMADLENYVIKCINIS